jgi:gliding motility-associated protein GldE
MISIEPSSLSTISLTIQPGTNMSVLVFGFIILGSLFLISAFSSGSESAFFSIGPKEKEKLRSDESRSAKMVLKLLEDPKELLATLLITNNLVNIGIIILSSSLLNEIFPVNPGNRAFVFIAEIVGITFSLLMLGEVIPKVYSSRNPIQIARMMALPINTIKSIPPLSWLKMLLVNGTNFIQKISRETSVKISTEELEQAIALTKESATSEEEHKILEGIVRFGNTEACQIMHSRLEVVALDETENFDAVLTLIRETGYSRIPVYKESFDHVIGILFTKDLLPYLSEETNFDWRKMIRKPFFIPENKKIDDLMKEFQEKKMHMAIVVDEYGGASGLITLEDILEEIVGEINDEFDGLDIVYSKINETTFVFEGRTTLVDFYKVVGIDGKEFEVLKGESETLGGFMVEQAGRILKNNEYIVIENIKLIVESSDKRRVKTVKTITLSDSNA